MFCTNFSEGYIHIVYIYVYKYVNSNKGIFLLFKPIWCMHNFIELQWSSEHLFICPKCNHAAASKGTIIMPFVVAGIFRMLMLY